MVRNVQELLPKVHLDHFRDFSFAPTGDVVMSLDPFARLEVIAEVLAEILLRKFNISIDVVELMMQPILSVLSISHSEGLLDGEVFGILREKKLIDSLLDMRPVDINSVMTEVGRIRGMLPTGEKLVLAGALRPGVDTIGRVTKELKGILFDNDMKMGIVSRLVPSVLFDMMYLEELYQGTRAHLERNFGITAGRHGIFSILSLFSDEYGNNGLSLDSDLGEFLSTKQDVAKSLVTACETCMVPLVDVVRNVYEIADSMAVLISNMLTIPAMSLDLTIMLVMTAEHIVKGVVDLKFGVLKMIGSMSQNTLEGFMETFSLERLTDMEILGDFPNFPLQMFPGGMPVFKGIVETGKGYLTAYKSLLSCMDLEERHYTLENFAQQTMAITRRAESLQCDEEYCEMRNFDFME